MQGFKTILALLVGAFLVPYAAKRGLNLDADAQATVIAFGMAAIGIIFRLVTTGPAFQSFTDWIKSRATRADLQALKRVSPEVVDIIAKAVVAELRASRPNVHTSNGELST